MNHVHKPTKTITRFDDAWMGSIRSGNCENRQYEPILCSCGARIRANRDLSKWIADEKAQD